MKKKISKQTKATADKAAHAKELKRIRDAKYRAKKAAAKVAAADKPKEQAKPECGCGGKCRGNADSDFAVMIMGSTLLAQGLALRAVAEDKKQPTETRKLCFAAWKIGRSALAIMNTDGKEVR